MTLRAGKVGGGEAKVTDWPLAPAPREDRALARLGLAAPERGAYQSRGGGRRRRAKQGKPRGESCGGGDRESTASPVLGKKVSEPRRRKRARHRRCCPPLQSLCSAELSGSDLILQRRRREKQRGRKRRNFLGAWSFSRARPRRGSLQAEKMRALFFPAQDPVPRLARE